MEFEVDVAVTWWTAHLERAGAAANTGAFSRRPAANTAEVNAFRVAFRRALMAYLQPSWRPDEPTWGQGTRAFGVRYGPDDVLATAIDESGIRGSAWLPIETTMWIDPGEVRVRVGRRAPTETLWKQAPESQYQRVVG